MSSAVTKKVSDWRARADANGLLRTIHERLGLGVDIQTFTDGMVEIRWKRDYRGRYGWSDERYASADSISAALEAVLDYEDRADAKKMHGVGSVLPDRGDGLHWLRCVDCGREWAEKDSGAFAKGSKVCR